MQADRIYAARPPIEDADTKRSGPERDEAQQVGGPLSVIAGCDSKGWCAAKAGPIGSSADWVVCRRCADYTQVVGLQ